VEEVMARWLGGKEGVAGKGLEGHDLLLYQELRITNYEHTCRSGCAT